MEAKRQRVLNRLARLEGQLRGVQKMIREDHECEDIIRQLSACHAALESSIKQVLLNYFQECLARGEHGNDGMTLDRLADLMMKTRF